MRRAFLAFAAFALAAGSAFAQSTNDIAPFSFIPEIPYGLVLHGPIDMRSPLAFKRALQQHPGTSAVILQSEGGSVQAALLIAEEIHDRHIKTLIPAGSLCASACSYLFFAGVERLDLGQLGVHQISGSEDIESTQLNLSDIFETLAKYNVSSDVITKMLRTPPNDIYIFTPAEVMALDINKTSGGVQSVSAPVTAEPVDPDQENKAKQFVLGLVTASSLPKGDLLSLASNIYSDDVSFYGSVKSKADVLTNKANYADRWPMRSSVVHPESISSSCYAARCRVSGVYDWQVFDPKRNKRAAGSAQFIYEVQMGGTPTIVTEDGRILSRDKQGRK